MLSIDIDARGLGTVGIEDAEGCVQDYRVRLVPRGLSLWAVELTRVDTQTSYLVRVHAGNRWECECPAEKYRKRGADHCKHIAAMTAFRAWLTSFLETNREVPNEQRVAS